MKRQCILTGVHFDTKNREENISPVARDAIVNLIKRDEMLRKEVSAALLADVGCLTEIAKAMLSVDACDVGLKHPGSVGEFFLELREQMAEQEA